MKNIFTKYGPYLVFIAAMLWASDAPFRVHLIADLPSSFVVLLEHAISLLVLVPLLYLSFKEFKGLSIKQWLSIGFISIFGSAVALILFTQSFNYMNPSVVILLQKLQPLIAVTLAITLLKEHVNKRFWLWAIVAMAGAYLVSFPDVVPQLFEGETLNPHVTGVLLALGAAVLWATSTVLGKYVLNTISFKAMTSVRFLVGFIFLLFWNMIEGTFVHFAQLTAKDWLFFVIISITSGAVAMFIYYRGLSQSKASIATVAELGFPLAAVVVNYVFLDATLSLTQVIGMVVLLYSVMQLGKVNEIK